MNDQFQPGVGEQNVNLPAQNPTDPIPPVPPVAPPTAQPTTPAQPVMPPQPVTPPVQNAYPQPPAAPQPPYQAPVQQPVYQQPPVAPQPPYPPAQPNYYVPQPAAKKTNGFAVAALICGIVSLLSCCCGWLSIILGILAVVFAIVSRKGDNRISGMAIAGIICGGIGLVGGLLLLILMLADPSFYNEFLESFMEGYEYGYEYGYDAFASLFLRR